MQQQQQLPPYHNIGYSPCVNFVPDGPAYRTCCCHVTRGTLIIGAVVMALSIIGLVLSAISYPVDSLASLGIKIPVAICSIILSVMLVLAVKYEKPILLIPFLIWQVVYFIGAVVLAGFLIWVLVVLSRSETSEPSTIETIATTPKSPLAADDDDSAAVHKWFFGLSLIHLLACILTAALDVYFFHVVKRCYGYFKDKIALSRVTNVTGDVTAMPEAVCLQYGDSL